MDELLLQDYIHMAYHAYAQCIAKAAGTYQHSPAKHMQHWTKIARLCMTYGIDPETLIYARFDICDEPLRRTLKPKQMYTPKQAVMGLVDRYKEKHTRDISKMWQSMLIHFNMAKTYFPTKTKDEILADPNQPFTPWFRILYADQLTPHLEEWYLLPAVDEYRINPELRRYVEESLNGKNAKRITGVLSQGLPEVLISAPSTV